MLLDISNLTSGYSDREVIKRILCSVDLKEIVCVLGANGAGKTTLLRTVMGYIKPLKGEIRFDGEIITGYPSFEIAKRGISFVPQGNLIFPEMMVFENLRMGAFLTKDKNYISKQLTEVYSLFPILSERKNQRAGSLSGGERQMLGIGMALMSPTKLLILDEPSFGLSPIIIDSIFNNLQKLNAKGIAIFIAEQNVVRTLELASRGYVLELGLIKSQGDVASLRKNEEVNKAYLG